MKNLVKKAVLKAHNGNQKIVETFDFVSGASYMLRALKEMGALKAKFNFEDADDVEIFNSLDTDEKAN